MTISETNMADVHNNNCIFIYMICIFMHAIVIYLILVRKLKTKPMMGGDGKWEHEIGLDPQPSNFNSEGIAESSSNVSHNFEFCYKSSQNNDKMFTEV